MPTVSLIGFGGLGREHAGKENGKGEIREGKTKGRKNTVMDRKSWSRTLPFLASLRRGAHLDRLESTMERGGCKSLWTSSAEKLDLNSCVVQGGPRKAMPHQQERAAE
jgi:hypothetical protein